MGPHCEGHIMVTGDAMAALRRQMYALRHGKSGMPVDITPTAIEKSAYMIYAAALAAGHRGVRGPEGDGVVTRTHVEAVLRCSISEEDALQKTVSAVMTTADLNGDGLLQSNEFTAAVRRDDFTLVVDLLASAWAAAFTVLDGDGDGVVTVPDLIWDTLHASGIMGPRTGMGAFRDPTGLGGGAMIWPLSQPAAVQRGRDGLHFLAPLEPGEVGEGDALAIELGRGKVAKIDGDSIHVVPDDRTAEGVAAANGRASVVHPMHIDGGEGEEPSHVQVFKSVAMPAMEGLLPGPASAIFAAPKPAVAPGAGAGAAPSASATPSASPSAAVTARGMTPPLVALRVWQATSIDTQEDWSALLTVGDTIVVGGGRPPNGKRAAGADDDGGDAAPPAASCPLGVLSSQHTVTAVEAAGITVNPPVVIPIECILSPAALAALPNATTAANATAPTSAADDTAPATSGPAVSGLWVLRSTAVTRGALLAVTGRARLTSEGSGVTFPSRVTGELREGDTVVFLAPESTAGVRGFASLSTVLLSDRYRGAAPMTPTRVYRIGAGMLATAEISPGGLASHLRSRLTGGVQVAATPGSRLLLATGELDVCASGTTRPTGIRPLDVLAIGGLQYTVASCAGSNRITLQAPFAGPTSGVFAASRVIALSPSMATLLVPRAAAPPTTRSLVVPGNVTGDVPWAAVGAVRVGSALRRVTSVAFDEEAGQTSIAIRPRLPQSDALASAGGASCSSPLTPGAPGTACLVAVFRSAQLGGAATLATFRSASWRRPQLMPRPHVALLNKQVVAAASGQAPVPDDIPAANAVILGAMDLFTALDVDHAAAATRALPRAAVQKGVEKKASLALATTTLGIPAPHRASLLVSGGLDPRNAKWVAAFPDAIGGYYGPRIGSGSQWGADHRPPPQKASDEAGGEGDGSGEHGNGEGEGGAGGELDPDAATPSAKPSKPGAGEEDDGYGNEGTGSDGGDSASASATADGDEDVDSGDGDDSDDDSSSSSSSKRGGRKGRKGSKGGGGDGDDEDEDESSSSSDKASSSKGKKGGGAGKGGGGSSSSEEEDEDSSSSSSSSSESAGSAPESQGSDDFSEEQFDVANPFEWCDFDNPFGFVFCPTPIPFFNILIKIMVPGLVRPAIDMIAQKYLKGQKSMLKILEALIPLNDKKDSNKLAPAKPEKPPKPKPYKSADGLVDLMIDLSSGQAAAAAANGEAQAPSLAAALVSDGMATLQRLQGSAAPSASLTDQWSASVSTDDVATTLLLQLAEEAVGGGRSAGTGTGGAHHRVVVHDRTGSSVDAGARTWMAVKGKGTMVPSLKKSLGKAVASAAVSSLANTLVGDLHFVFFNHLSAALPVSMKAHLNDTVTYGLEDVMVKTLSSSISESLIDNLIAILPAPLAHSLAVSLSRQLTKSVSSAVTQGVLEAVWAQSPAARIHCVTCEETGTDCHICAAAKDWLAETRTLVASNSGWFSDWYAEYSAVLYEQKGVEGVTKAPKPK